MEEQKAFWGTNIKALRQRNGRSQEALAGELGITRAKLSAHENGQTQNPTVEDLFAFSRHFKMSIDAMLKVDMRQCSEAQLQEWEGNSDSYASGKALRILATTVNRNNEEQVEFVPLKASAGYRSGYADPEFIAELPRYSLPGLSPHRKHRIFPIAGDSMLPFPDGCSIVGEYVEDWRSLKSGTRCILILKSGGADFVFKEVENRIAGEKRIIARSLNPLYAPYEIPVGDILEIWQYHSHLAQKVESALPAEEVQSQLIRIVAELKEELSAWRTGRK